MKTLLFNPFYVHAMLPFSVHSTLPKVVHAKLLITSPLEKLNNMKKVDIPVDYFQFYKSVSSVYSSKIEGEDIDFDSFFKHKFLKVKFKPDYTKKTDDLYAAYDFIENKKITLKNVQKAHSILSSNLLPKSQQGIIRTNPILVINSNDQIEYIAASPEIVKTELNKLFDDIELLINTDLNPFEIFYYASFCHLIFVKIHPFQDGNGRSEERRVGKECRSRWSQYHDKKKNK